MWADEVGHIPSEALAEIVSTTIRNVKVMPTPHEVQTAYHDWIGTHPKKIARRECESCNVCDGDGYFPVWYTVPGYTDPVSKKTIWASTFIACGHCRNYQDNPGCKGIPRLTKEQALQKDYRLSDPDLDAWKAKRIFPRSDKSVQEMATDVGIPF
jgi:hypothetical protein